MFFNITLLKQFGRVIDIDKLDNISINKPAEELKEKIRLTNIKNQNEIHKQKVCIIIFLSICLLYFLLCIPLNSLLN